MALFDTLNDFAKNVTDKTSGTLEATKLATRISALNRVIVEAQQKIGAYYYNKLKDNGETPDADIQVYFEQIQETQESIDEMRTRIAAIKSAVANPLDPGKKLCEKCGAVMSVKAKFCSECGAPNIVEDVEEDTTIPVEDEEPSAAETDHKTEE
ncbi:MAG: zinc ribbon domain-containing protein [Eubacteriaceae bacterium]|jgi:RNA polymerase subunit RPABC4/transcription elongation factor Spt4|nr:zinc ribbon domain-containing protein [Eubacteriaceae bacterium]